MEPNDPKPVENYWKCGRCGYILRVQTPPAVCPSCKEQCDFLNVTCYQPECGFQGIDPRL